MPWAVFLVIFIAGVIISFLIQLMITRAYEENMDWPLVLRQTVFWPYYAVVILYHRLRR